MAKLFVSYSRKDSIAARRLIEAFRSIEQDVWVDWESIPPAVDWLEQIFRGIEEADAFIFLISPDSIASEVCKVEIGRAALNNKRIIPVVLRDVHPKDTPESISKLNWTFMRETDNFEEGLAKVKTAIQLDLDWLEEHRRLQVRALEWHRKKDISLLLRGRDLRNAQRMVATATAKDPSPTDLQKTFILHSKKNERNRTIAWIATGIALVLMSVLTYTAIQQSRLAAVNEKRALENADLAIRNQQAAEENERVARANEEEARAQKAIAEENRQIAEENKKIAEAQRSVARAQIYQTRPGELYTSTLLAIDSWNSIPSAEAEEILRTNISLLPLPVAQLSQAGSISAVEFGPNGDMFVTASADGTTCAWNAEAGTKLFCATSPGAVNDVAFSADGSLIVTGDAAGAVQVVEAENGKVVHEYRRFAEQNGLVQIVDIKSTNAPAGSDPLEIAVRQVNIQPATRQLLAIAYDDGNIPLIDMRTGKLNSPLEASGRPNVTEFSSNGTWLAAGSDTGVVTIWNLSDTRIVSGQKHKGQILSMAFSPNNRIVATAGKDNSAVITDVRTGKELLRILNENWVRDIVFSPDGAWFVTVSDDQRIRIWDTATGKEQLRMLQDSIVTQVRVSSNGQWIATAGEDKTVRVWNAGTGAEIFQIPLAASGSDLAFSQDGKYLVTSDQRGGINVWDISVMAAPEKTVQLNGIARNVQYSPSGDWLVASDENRVWLWNSRQLADLTMRAQGAPILQFKSSVRDVIFNLESTALGILTEGNEVAIYTIANRGLKTLKATNPVTSIAFSPDHREFITSDSDGNLQSWDALNANLIDSPGAEFAQAYALASSREFLAIGSRDKIALVDGDSNGGYPAIESLGVNTLIAFNTGGSRLASSDSSGRVSIWQYENGEITETSSFVKEPAVSLAFNPAGSLLAIGTAKNVYLIDTKAGEEVARIPHIDIVNGVSFSADGNTVVTASSKTLQFWNVATILENKIETNDLVPTACSRLIQNFDTAQWNALFGDKKYEPLCLNLPVPE